MTDGLDPVDYETGRAMGVPVECPDLGTFEAAPLAPDIHEHVEICDSCQLVIELLAAANPADHCIQFEPLLAAKADGAIGRAADNLLDRHLAICEGCRAVAATLAPTADAEGDHDSLPRVDPSAYALGLEVGRGGMGRVLAARDLRVGRPVAVKELLGRSRQLAVRFEREARVTARLQHPGIVPIYEIGQWPDGTPFYSMRMVEGRTLRETIDGASTLADRLALLPAVLAAAEAVAFAHAQRIIHRDLTPSNVLVGAYGETVVIDWGLAKDLNDASDEEPEVRPHRSYDGLTGVGAVIGTAAYMPPEQANAEPVDERADVYALGAILYHLLAGAAPYRSRKTDDPLRELKAGPPKRIEQIAPATPRDLVSIVSKAMSRDPSARYPTARELAEELKRFQNGRMVEAHEYTSAERMKRFVLRNRAPLTVTVFAIVVLGVLGAVAVTRIYRERAAAENTVVTLLEEEGRVELLAGNSTRALAFLEAAYKSNHDSASLKFLVHTALQDVISVAGDLDCGGDVRDLSFSPDHSSVIAGCHDLAKVWRLSDRTLTTTLPTFEAGFDGVGYSHDGKTIATWGEDGKARLWDPLTGKLLHTLPHGTQKITFTWFSTDDRIAVTSGYDGWAKIWNTSTGELVRAINASDALIYRHLYGVLLPDNKRLVTVTIEGIGTGWDIETGEKLAVFHHGSQVIGGEVSPDGAYGVTAGVDRIVKIWDLNKPSLAVQFAANTNAVWSCRFSQDSKRVLCVSHDGHAQVWEIATGRTIASVDHGTPLWTGHFSPDGKRFVTIALGTIKVWDTETSGLLASHDTRGGRDAKFSPDGLWLIATRGDGRLRVWNAAEGSQRATFSPQAELLIAGFSSDGARAVTRPKLALDGRLTIYDTATGRLVGAEPLQAPYAMGAETDRLVALSMDMKTLRVVNLRDGTTNSTLEIVRPPRELKLSANGRRLVIERDGGPPEIWDVDTGARLAVLDHATHAILSPDGKRALAWASNSPPTVWRVDEARAGAHLAPEADFHPIGFGANGTRIVLAERSGARTETLTLWDSGDGRRLRSIKDSIAPLSLEIKGSKLATILTDRTIALWNLADGSTSSIVGEQLQEAEVDPTGSFVAGIDKHGGAVVVLGAAGGRLLARWPITHDAPQITQEGIVDPRATVSWSSDGQTIVTHSTRIAVWNAGTELPSDLDTAVKRNVPWKVDNGRLVPALATLHGHVSRGLVAVANASIVLVFRKPPDLGSEPMTHESTTTQTQRIELEAEADGTFTRSNLAPGEYTITVKGQGAGTRVINVTVSVEDKELVIDLARSTQ